MTSYRKTALVGGILYLLTFVGSMEHIVPYSVEVSLQINVDHLRLPHRNRVGDPG